MPRRLFLLLALVLVVLLGLAASSSPARGAEHAVAVSARDALTRPNRFACYAGQFSQFRARPKLVLLDNIARKLTAYVLAPEEVCAPAVGADDRYADWFLTCYRAKVSTTFVGTTKRAPADEFRTRTTLSLSRPSRLCVPAVRIGKGGRRTPSATLDRFTCYTARPSLTIRNSGVDVSDTFGDSADVVSGPSRLCSPAWESPSGSAFDRRWLTCYALLSETTGTLIVVKDMFGYLKAALGPRGRLCVSAA